MNAIERWLPVPGYEGLYEVSDAGRFRSFYFDPPRILRLSKDSHAYPVAMLSKDRKRKPFTAHRLVALAFHGDKRNVLHCQVAHLDGDKTNPTAANLKWVSKIENESHKHAHGTRNSALYSRLTHEQVVEIRSLLGTMTLAKIGARFGISWRTVEDIARGKRWPERNRPDSPTIIET